MHTMHIVQCTLYLYAQPHSVSHMSHVTYMMCTDTDTHILCCHTSHVSKQSTEHAAHKKKLHPDGSLVPARTPASSTARQNVRGMPGTPVVDMLAVVRHVPPTDSQRAALGAAGFPGPGTLTDHTAEDWWWFGGDAGAASGTLGRCVLHVVAEDNPWIAQAKAFVSFLNGSSEASRAAFGEYAEIKREGARLAAEHGAEGNKLSDYKRRKHDVCVRLLEQAAVSVVH